MIDVSLGPVHLRFNRNLADPVALETAFQSILDPASRYQTALSPGFWEEDGNILPDRRC